MTGHFTTLDQCERWAQIPDAPEFLQVPYSTARPLEVNDPFPINGYTTYAYRLYRLKSYDFSRGLAEYVEVYSG